MKKYALIDLETFVAVVESDSFSQAAERLNTSPASVSRRISALEDALAARLITRTTRRLRLTEAGQQFFSEVSEILAALQEAEEKLHAAGTSIKGNLRIAAPMSFGIQVISPLLPGFLKQHPELTIDLKLEDQQTDLYAEGIDLAIRIGKLSDSSLIATHLCDIEFGYYASPAYIAERGEPGNLDELVDHAYLHYSLTSRTLKGHKDGKTIELQGQLSANNGEALCEAAIQGLGIVTLPGFIAERALEKKQLVEILPEYKPVSSGLYVLRLGRRFTSARVRLLIEYLRQQLTS